MKILCDFHHQDLFYSLQLLFEKRLGFELYRPIGLEWFHEGYWNVFPHIDTAKQYLSLDQAIQELKTEDGEPWPESHKLNKFYREEDGIYYVKDMSKGGILQRAIRLDKFKEMKFNILLSSIPQHIGPFNKLVQLYQPQAKHIFQVGNAWGELSGVQNILASAAPFHVSPGINTCFYHQEFDLDTYRYDQPDPSIKKIRSFIHYMRQMDLHQRFKQLLPEFEFITHGAGMDSCFSAANDIAIAYQDTTFAWHVKPEGDGFGYGAHCPFACGRPLITVKQHYRGKLAEALMLDKETCIDIGCRSIEESVRLIRHFAQPEEHKAMCQRAYDRFKEVVDYDKEEQTIRQFLENLK